MAARIEYEVGDRLHPESRLRYCEDIEPYVSPTGVVARRALFLCDDGNFVASRVVHVKSGKTLSCGCYQAERVGQQSRKWDCPTCHGTLSHDGNRPPTERCPEANRTMKEGRARYAKANRFYLEETRRQRLADRIERGEQFYNRADHHLGMRALVERQGVTFASDDTLSLVDADSPACYIGYAIIKALKVPYLLSMNPDDYCAEPIGENKARGNPTARYIEDHPDEYAEWSQRYGSEEVAA